MENYIIGVTTIIVSLILAGVFKGKHNKTKQPVFLYLKYIFYLLCLTGVIDVVIALYNKVA